MLIDGIRFACNTCIRGHRAAQCQHNDRPLHLVRGKGRPVSQCGHCRSLRQTRSVHTMSRCRCIHGECRAATHLPSPPKSSTPRTRVASTHFSQAAWSGVKLPNLE
ncbi:copper fist DNA binding domain-containing protein [Coniochaeta sp. 2T2.1]|nr:copper fist DNA binding domain-containing protein [Coniochaeta sp. 2T2.1]